jgi:hypothetical protein
LAHWASDIRARAPHYKRAGAAPGLIEPGQFKKEPSA